MVDPSLYMPIFQSPDSLVSSPQIPSFGCMSPNPINIVSILSKPPPQGGSYARKRRKTSREMKERAQDINSVQRFDTLPFEILSEILLFTESSSDVLSVARCSRFLCTTLLHPSSSFIWRGARKTCSVPPPEPMSIFTEASYAAFLFGGGLCDVCKKHTATPYCSFGIRLRLCSFSCKMEFVSSGDYTIAYTNESSFHPAIKYLPYIEKNNCLLPDRLGHSPLRLYRKSDFEREVGQALENKIAFVEKYMKFCIKLHEWSEWRDILKLSIESANETFAKQLAINHGWDVYDMLNSTEFGRLHRLRCNRIEAVTQGDYDSVASKVEKSLAKLAMTREQRTRNITYKKNRDDIEKHLQRLRSQQPPIPLPSLEVFRHLPIVKLLQGTSPATVEYDPKKEVQRIAKTLRDEEWVGQRLDTELRQWTEKAKRDLGAVLGFLNWSSASTKILHPVDRLTARFICKLCEGVASRYSQDGSLDFVGACAHTCRTAKKDKRSGASWSADWFVKDEKAIAALHELFALCCVDGSLADDFTLETLGTTIVCTSCTPELVLDARSVAGHSHRHEKMKMRILSKQEAIDFLHPYPFQPSLVHRLYGSQVRLKPIREMKIFGCRHCFMLEWQAKPIPSTELVVLGQANARAKREIQSRFSFGGVKDHLSKKHDIKDVRDEDIFSCTPIEFPPKK